MNLTLMIDYDRYCHVVEYLTSTNRFSYAINNNQSRVIYVNSF